MSRALISAALLAGVALMASGQPDRNTAMLDAARRAALSYARHLPDFVCTQFVRRLGDWHSTGEWVPIDTLTVAVSFHDQRETYQLVGRNNRPSKQKLHSLSGTFSQGEFGSVLRLIFDPESKTGFSWQGWDLSGIRPLAVFDYRVRVENSHYALTVLTKAVVVGFHGEVAIDPESGRTMRWTVEAEPPAHFPISETVATLEYGLRDIGGADYLLPIRAEVVAAERPPDPESLVRLSHEKQLAASRTMRYRNVIEFRDYRKFSADTRITF